MKKELTIILLLLCGVACSAPQDKRYCQTHENMFYDDCMAHYRDLEFRFHHDADACTENAKRAVPESLYDAPHTDDTNILDTFGLHTRSQLADQSAGKNGGLDERRRGLINACMQGKGWQQDDAIHWALGIGKEEEVIP